MTTVIFACVHNAGRSQMAAAFFNAFADLARVRAVSAGTAPAERVHPEVVAAMREVGIDLGGSRPQRLTDELAASAQVLVTMGCGEACPVVPGLKRDDWPIDDPKGLPPRRGPCPNCRRASKPQGRRRSERAGGEAERYGPLFAARARLPGHGRRRRREPRRPCPQPRLAVARSLGYPRT